MAHKNDSALIHCNTCGEDYSATYKFCPFCGAHNAPEPAPAADKRRPAKPQAARPAQSAEYEFDGQDVFDQPDEEPAGGKGGKRLAGGGAPHHPTSPPPVNWPRLITFLCSLVIIAVVLVLSFKVFYPHLRQVSNPGASEPPAVTTTVTPATSDPAGTGDAGLNGMILDTSDLTLQAQQSHPLTLTFDPVDWQGTVTWTSSDQTCATVNEEGVVTNVNTSATQRRAIITATVGTQSVTCTVYCQSGSAATPAPEATQTPVATPEPTPSQTPQSSGDIEAGSQGAITNASSGLRVRSGPGTSYEALASLNNGDPITVVSYAGDGWYEITFDGSNGKETGYIMGEYISVG